MAGCSRYIVHRQVCGGAHCSPRGGRALEVVGSNRAERDILRGAQPERVASAGTSNPAPATAPVYSSQVQAYSGFGQPPQMCVSSLMREFFGFASAVVLACTTTW